MNTKNNNGFTLVEVIVSMTILVIVVAFFSNLIFTGLKNRNMNREKLEIIAVTTSTIEEIKSRQSTWLSAAGLSTWLQENSFILTEQNTYSKTKTDTNNISYDIRVTINSNINVTGLFELTVSAGSSNINRISIVTRLRG